MVLKKNTRLLRETKQINYIKLNFDACKISS